MATIMHGRLWVALCSGPGCSNPPRIVSCIADVPFRHMRCKDYTDRGAGRICRWIPRIIHFIEDNTTAFKAIHGRYTAYWLGTKFSWKNDLSTCSATLQSITASFEIGNSTLPFVGMAHVTIDPSMTRVVNVQFDFPSFQPYQKLP